MKKSFSLSIPNPCHEKWENFSATAQGGFCSKCQKEVIDFTLWDEERIKDYFKNSTHLTCGRFRSHQLKKYIIDTTRPPGGVNWWQISMLSIGIGLAAGNALGQENPKHCQEIVQRSRDKTQNDLKESSNSRQVSGIVKDNLGNGIPGVNVILKGTSFGTTTDFEGRFTITISTPQSSDVLIFSFIGYMTVEQSIDNMDYVSVLLEEDVAPLGGIVMLGVRSRHWWSPRSIWWRIKNIF